MSHSTSVRGSWGSRGLAWGMTGGVAGLGGIQSQKESMQYLNRHLTAYLERVSSLETYNGRLERKILEHLEEKWPQKRLETSFQDHRGPEGSDLCKVCGQCCITLQIDNAHLVAEDIWVKYRVELVCGEWHQWAWKVQYASFFYLLEFPFIQIQLL